MPANESFLIAACGALYRRVVEFPPALILGDFSGDLEVIRGLGYALVGLLLCTILEGVLPSSTADGINCISRKAFIRIQASDGVRLSYLHAGRGI